MRLKNLTIKGFKSFANETSLNFNDDVIGVVGPNGSGKSNVVDAIRWVLGEQKSKELRLEKMSDIIFNGTKKRKQASTAQVTLTFENNKGLLPSEYNTIAVSRVLYRSGESEYRLNGVTCRLKDVTSLLMDTGIGSNSYAIIALGMVDDILADKESSRRRMFEQAAGVSKYKRRKKETLSKLKGTTNDLDRVEDLLFEIEGNLKSLEKQAKRAQKYLDLKAKYKELAIVYAQVSMQSLKVEYKRLGTELKTEQDKYSGLDAEVRKKEAILEKEKKQNLEKEESLSSSQKMLNELVTNIRIIEADKNLLDQKQKFKQSSAFTLKSTISNGKEELETLVNELEKLQKTLKDVNSEYSGQLTKVEKLKQKYDAIKNDHKDAKVAHDDRSLKRERLNKSAYNSEKEIALIKNNADNILATLKRENTALDAKKSEYKTSKSALEKIDSEILLKSESIKNLTDAEEARKKKLTELETDQEEGRADLVKITRTIDSKQNEYDLLKSMIDNFEGFPESIKFLSKNWRKDVPILSDLLDVEDKYKGIIEQYLSPYLNYYIVNDIEEAKKAINLLSTSQKGKANFFLLDHIKKEKYILPSIADTTPATSKISIDNKYFNLLNYLLKDVFVYSNTLSSFSALGLPSTYTYLSADGSFLKGNNYISGGSIGLFEGKKIGRKKNLEKLSKDLNKLNERKEKLLPQIDKIKNKILNLKTSDHNQSIRLLQSEKGRLEQTRAGYITRIDVYKQLKKEIKTKEEISKNTLKSLNEQLKTITKLLSNTKKELSELSENIGNEANLEHLNDILAESSQKYNDANIGLIQQQNRVNNISKDIEYKQSRVHDMERRIKQDKIRRRDELDQVKSIQKSIVGLEKQLISQYEIKKFNEDKLSTAEQLFYSARTVINETEDELRKITRAQNQIQLKVQQIRDKYTDVKFKISAVSERVKIEFGISINEIINTEIDNVVEQDGIEEKVERLKNRLANYGDVNPMAVEAYNEMNARYQNISKQRADILDAKESLLLTIKEIESTATSLFLTAFDQVRTNFIDVFRSLFSEEDTCDLVLLDPDNPLESKIEIIAKPKGKKPKSLSQLSGGEKTLTAIALLFALYLLKPAPFCIFDEVDAPLDDANIQKFNKIIHKFSKDSQFIIVTHNKSTMSSVDILYGVYMQELGVSQVTPVDFRNFDNVDTLHTIS
ncbi:MAG: chromosome segregation protein SMC [Saprospiraceae bacterium]